MRTETASKLIFEKDPKQLGVGFTPQHHLTGEVKPPHRFLSGRLTSHQRRWRSEPVAWIKRSICGSAGMLGFAAALRQRLDPSGMRRERRWSPGFCRVQHEPGPWVALALGPTSQACSVRLCLSLKRVVVVVVGGVSFTAHLPQNADILSFHGFVVTALSKP